MLIGNHCCYKSNEFLESLIRSNRTANGVDNAERCFRIVGKVVFDFFEDLIKRLFHTFKVNNIDKDILPDLDIGLTPDEESLKLRDDLVDVTGNEGAEEWVEFEGFERLGFFVHDSLVKNLL